MKSRCGIVELILNVQTLNKQSTIIQWQSGLGQRFKLLALNAVDKFTRPFSDSTQIHQPQPKSKSLFIPLFVPRLKAQNIRGKYSNICSFQNIQR